MKMKRLLSSILCICLLTGMLSVSAAAADTTITLREDWRLTSDLDLNVPKGETLTIDGQGMYYIYELPGQLLNSGLGVVKFEDTILYPATSTGLTSDQLMLERQPHAIAIADSIANGSITIGSDLTQAKKGDGVTLTVSPEDGYELDTLAVTASEGNDAGNVTVSGSGTTYNFTMPASDVTVTATFKQSGTTPVTTYAVTFEANGGTGSMSGATVNAGSSYTLPTNGFTAPTNQQFKAWKISDAEYAVGDTYVVNADTSVIAVWEDISVAPATYTVTVNSSYANSTGAGSYAEGASVTISAGNRSNYSFTGWTASGVTLSSPGSTTTTFTMPANAVTVTANWSYNAPSYSDNDDYTPSTPPTESVTVPISGDEETIHVGASVKGDTATIDEVDLSKLETVIGDDVDTGTVTIDFSGLDSSKPITTVEIPSDVVKQIAEAVNNPANDAESLEIILSDGISIEFDAEALGEKAAQADGLDITISIENAKDAKPNQKQEAALKGRPAYDITVTSGGEHISDMGGKITVHAPYELQDGEHPRGIIVWYVDEDGKRERCETSYDPVKKRVNWKTDHLSLYMIDYDESAINPFTDISEDTYYYEAVLWALDNEITSGTSATTFSPDDPCTRAQMATFLWRAAGSPDPVGNSNPFADVSEDAYYAKAVQWAYEQDITGGTSSTTYSPDAPCTRGQMVTFLHRVAGTPKPVDSINPFTDVPDAYYTEAVQWAYEQGITAGTSATTFSPDEICARGQMVTFLYRFFVK